MPDGSYRMSQASAAESIQEPPRLRITLFVLKRR
jgi:hypothetical protein